MGRCNNYIFSWWQTENNHLFFDQPCLGLKNCRPQSISWMHTSHYCTSFSASFAVTRKCCTFTLWETLMTAHYPDSPSNQWPHPPVYPCMHCEISQNELRLWKHAAWSQWLWQTRLSKIAVPGPLDHFLVQPESFPNGYLIKQMYPPQKMYSSLRK